MEQLLLATMADLGATPDRPRQMCGPMVEKLAVRHAVHPVHGYGALVTLAADWLVPFRLVDGHGDLGSADYGPAEMAYVEARLSPAGLLAVRDEALLDGVLALALGDLAFGGRRPPFPLAGIQAAVQALLADPDVDAGTIRSLVGAPVFVGGAEPEGSVDDLLAGRPTSFRLRACIEDRPGHPQELSITRLPTGVGATTATRELSSALGLSGPDPAWNPDDGPWEPMLSLPLAALEEAPIGYVDRILATVTEGAHVDEVRLALRELDPLAVDLDLALPAPIEDLLRQVLDGQEPAALLGALDELVAAAEWVPERRGGLSYMLRRTDDES